jgi:hypothetical protein
MSKKKIIAILKDSEQRDYKRGGVSIAPEMYEAIADKINRELINPEQVAKEHFRINEVEALIDITKMYDETDLFNAYKAGERKQTFRKRNGSVILPNGYEGVDG